MNDDQIAFQSGLVRENERDQTRSDRFTFGVKKINISFPEKVPSPSYTTASRYQCPRTFLHERTYRTRK